jgi:hypothetical protein
MIELSFPFLCKIGIGAGEKRFVVPSDLLL